MTYLQLVNSVLRRLREDEVTSVTENSYSKLIGELINETKREVEDAYEWVALRDTVVIETVGGVFRYNLNVVNKRFKVSMVFNDTDNSCLIKKPTVWLTKQFNGTSTTGKPIYYDFPGLSVDSYSIDLYPIPDGVYNINVDMSAPQNDLVLDTDELIVHEYPVMLGAYAKAVAERGDDKGVGYPVAYQAYRDALSDAIQIDASRKVSESLDWYQS